MRSAEENEAEISKSGPDMQICINQGDQAWFYPHR